MTRKRPQRTSELLQTIIDNTSDKSISLGEFTALLGDRAFALAILVFSLPNSLPVPGIPGFSTITGLPIIFIAAQMVMGRSTIWLPKKVAKKRFSMATMKKMLGKAIPAVRWLEKLLRPRWVVITSPRFERVIGLMFVIQALVISLPMPGGNFLPGVSMSLIALGLLEKDGLFICAALAFATASLVFMFEIIKLFFTALGKGLGKIF